MEQTPAAKVAFLKALNKVQGTMEPVTTDSQNPHFGSKYASLAAVNAAVMGPLTENGFSLLQGGADINGKPYLRTTLFHVEGHSESFDYPLIVGDANPQHLASATTYARRYAICALLNLSTEDDDGEGSTGRASSAAATAPAKQWPSPAGPEQPQFGDARFVPSRVEFEAGKGKGAGKTFSAIYDPKGTKFNGDETQGEIAEAAKSQGKEIVLAFERKGQYINIKRGSLKMVGAPAPVEEVPF